MDCTKADRTKTMSWTRSHDDKCQVQKTDTDNVSSLKYVLDPIKYYCTAQCRPVKGIVAGNEVSVIQGNLVDLESELQGMFGSSSRRCGAKRHAPQHFLGASNVHVCDKCPVGTNPYFCIHRDPKVEDINANLDHLPECKFFDLPTVPPQPTFAPFKCP